jgi:lysophospholipase L1-like esterase
MNKLREMFFAVSLLMPSLAKSEPCGRVVFYGDSLAADLFSEARRGGWQSVNAAIPGVGIINGTSADHARMRRQNLNAVQPGNIVLFSIGTNDMAYIRNDADKQVIYANDFRRRLGDVIGRGGQPIILGISTGAWPSFNAAQRSYVNGGGEQMIMRIAQEMNVPYIQTVSSNLPRADGLHYTSQGYSRILATIPRVFNCEP